MDSIAGGVFGGLVGAIVAGLWMNRPIVRRITVGSSEKIDVVYKYIAAGMSDEVWVDGKLLKRRISPMSRVQIKVGERESHDVAFHVGVKELFNKKPVAIVDGVVVPFDPALEADRKTPLPGGPSASPRTYVPLSGIWPDIKDKRSAQQAILMAVIAGVVSILLTTAVIALPLFGIGKPVPGFDASVIGDILIMAVLVLGLAFKSRISACAMAAYFIAAKIALGAQFPHLIIGSLMLSVIFVVIFIGGVRGTFGYWKYSETRPKRFSWKIALGALFILCIFMFIGKLSGPPGLTAEQTADVKRIEALIAEGKYEDAITLSNQKFVGENAIPIDDATYFDINRRLQIGMNEGHEKAYTEAFNAGRFEEVKKETEAVLTWYGSGSKALNVTKADIDKVIQHPYKLVNETKGTLDNARVAEIIKNNEIFVRNEWSDPHMSQVMTQFGRADFVRWVAMEVLKKNADKPSPSNNAAASDGVAVIP